MYKEMIVSIVIIIAIIVGNIITENYTKKSVEVTTEQLNQLEIDLEKKEMDKETLEKKIEEIHNIWDNRHQKLAYYIEHDELEKVETNLTTLRSYIKTETYEDARAELEKSIYVLEHIKDKNAFQLQNIF